MKVVVAQISHQEAAMRRSLMSKLLNFFNLWLGKYDLFWFYVPVVANAQKIIYKLREEHVANILWILIYGKLLIASNNGVLSSAMKRKVWRVTVIKQKAMNDNVVNLLSMRSWYFERFKAI